MSLTSHRGTAAEAAAGTAAPRTRLVYYAPGDIQVARVDRQAIVYFCSALARAGVDVELVTLGIRLSDAETHRPDDPLDLYAVDPRFAVTTVATSLTQESGRRHWALERLRCHALHAVRTIRGDTSGLVLYTKNYGPALAFLVLRRLRGFTLLFEAHTVPRNRLQRRVLELVDGVVANSHALARELGAVTDATRVIGTHQGVDLGPYRDAGGRDDARSRLGLRLDRRIVVYTGKIYTRYEEVELILRAAASPALADVDFLLVGGRSDHVAWWRDEARRRGLANVRFAGFVQPKNIHDYHLAADVLVLYYPAGHALNDYRSPGKLFGYMASGAPIVTVDLPVLREVLGDPPTAVLVPPDSPTQLAEAIVATLGDAEASARRAATARAYVERFTWDARAREIAAFAASCGARRHRPGASDVTGMEATAR